MRINNIELKNKIIFITGAAGFIGSNLVIERKRKIGSFHSWLKLMY